MKLIPLILLFGVALFSTISAEVTETETWYDADGAVVKTISRTYTGRDAARITQNKQWRRSRVQRNGTAGIGFSRNYINRHYSTRIPYYSGVYSSYPNYYYPRYSGNDFRRSVNFRNRGTRFGFSYRTPRFSLIYRR